MILDTGNPEVQFQPRPFNGVSITPEIEPDHLILDGSKRLTALFQSLMKDEAVTTFNIRNKDKKFKLWYYFDINKILDPNSDKEDCIVALHEDKVIRDFRGQIVFDYSKPDAEYKAGLFPINKIFQYADWMMENQKYWNFDREKIIQFNQFNEEIIKRFEQYQTPRHSNE